ncbi:preprotein translocase subunit YajC [Arthrobacter pigmenti]
MFVNVLAESTQGSAQGGGGFDPFLLIMLAIFGIFIFMMFRRNKKAQKQVQEQQSKMAPGVEVMTSYGLFGTVVSLDEAENKVVLELSPGNHATVHRQSVTKIITVTEEDDVVPDDASSLTGGSTDSDARDADTDPADGSADRPEESARHPHEDDNDKDR